MHVLLRFILLVVAAISGLFVAFFGSSFSHANESHSYIEGISVAWLLAGALVVTPLWIPAIIPSRFPNALQKCRRISAILLLFPTFLFGSIIVYNIIGCYNWFGALPPSLHQGIELITPCVIGLLILLWPEISAFVKRILTHHSSGTPNGAP